MQSNSLSSLFNKGLMKKSKILSSLVIKLPIFPKGQPGCENESLKYVNCVGRFIIGITRKLDK